MFYRPEIDPMPLPYNPFKAIVAPRPIGWISTVNAKGEVNLAPYSFFNGISDKPPMVMYATSGTKLDIPEEKDSLVNIRANGEFCVSIVSYALRDAMNVSSAHYPHGQDEFELAGLEKGASQVVAPPFVAASPAAFECKLFKEIELPGGATVVIGEVVGVHIQDQYLKDGLLDVAAYQPLARLGYRDYSAVTEVFPLNRPEQS